jgi:hypothetical protein
MKSGAGKVDLNKLHKDPFPASSVGIIGGRRIRYGKDNKKN